MWKLVIVDVASRKSLKKPVTLAVLKNDRRTREMEMVRQGRLSVSRVTDAEARAILDLGETTLSG